METRRHRKGWGSWAVALAALAGLGACADRVVGYPPQMESWPTPVRSLAVVQAPQAPAVPLMMPPDLAGDPEAMRFHALRRLVDVGVVRPDEAGARRLANLGALLPFTAPPPAAGLARPAPLQDIADRLSSLSVQPAPSVAAERAVLLEALLPLEPKLRAAAARSEMPALRLGRDRIDRLSSAGLVSLDERQRELDAITQAERVLANRPPPPPPPPAPVKKKTAKKKPVPGSEGGLKPGDVPGGAMPPLKADPATASAAVAGVHLLSMASDTLTDKAVEAMKKEFPELAAMTFKAVKTDIPDLGTTYRLLAGPMTQAEADQLCKALRAKGQSCAVAGF